ncbi:Hint domain-containing protein [Pseudogemmobacter blasticus]|uniref:Hedgehog/Intein (Hint) domain-containing protein n=1 Tax=Fuscovulum blasticum DSM 2131 TaxID=1188250 RepID=A0A2T4J8R4_FUSBL|nr:Hint domain-containing protein [Fuscovulum blasticum]PTE14292.1 hypothetical protein C5F44_09845 [Fuscovulum blasticum DSM 2131]
MMATFTVVPVVTNPATQKLQGVINVTAGDTYIIDPTVSVGITFNPPAGTPLGTTVSYNIQINAANASAGTAQRLITLGDQTTANITIAPGVNAGRYDFGGGTVDGANYTIGAGATTGDLQLGDGGNGSLTTVTSSVTLGDGATVAGQITGGAGADTLTVGTNVTVTEAINLGAGAASGTFGTGFSAQSFAASGAGAKTFDFSNTTTFTGTGASVSIASTNAPVSVDFDDNLSTNGTISVSSSTGAATLDIGANLKTGNATLHTGGAISVVGGGTGSANMLTIGLDAQVNGAITINGSGGTNTLTIGDSSEVYGFIYANGTNSAATVTIGDLSTVTGDIYANSGGTLALGNIDNSVTVGDGTTTGSIFVNGLYSDNTVSVGLASTVGNLYFGTDGTVSQTDPTSGQVLTMADNSTAGLIYLTASNSTFDVTFGTGVTTNAIYGYGYNSDYNVSIPDDFTANGYVYFGSTNSTTDVTIGNNAVINTGALDISGSDVTTLIGDGLSVQYFASFGDLNGATDVTIGQGANIGGALYANGSTVDFTAGPDFDVSGYAYLNDANATYTIDIGPGSDIGGGFYANGFNSDVTLTTGDNFIVSLDAYIGGTDGTTTVTLGSGSSIGTVLNVGGDTVNFTAGTGLTTGGAVTFGDAVSLSTTVNLTGPTVFGGLLDVNGDQIIFNGGPNLTVNGPAYFTNDGGTSTIVLGDNTTINGLADFAAPNQDVSLTIGTNVTIGTIYGDTTGTGSFNMTTGDDFTFANFYGGTTDNDEHVTIGKNWTMTGSGVYDAGTGNDTLILGTTADRSSTNYIYGGESANDNDVLTFRLNAADQASFTTAALAAGWTLNPDGTFKTTNGAGAHIQLTWQGQVINYWESVAFCFAQGTEISTDAGPVKVEDLRPGSMVLTMDRGYQPVAWIGGRQLSGADLQRKPNLRPIRIAAGALGHGLPTADLVVSPQHRVLVRSRLSERMFSDREVLIAAKHLVGLPGITVAEEMDGVSYWHFLFEQHEIVYSNGAPTESLFTGPEALKALTPDQQQEILTLFPELSETDAVLNGDRLIPARTIVPGRLARSFTRRATKRGASDVLSPV